MAEIEYSVISVGAKSFLPKIGRLLAETEAENAKTEYFGRKLAKTLAKPKISAKTASFGNNQNFKIRQFVATETEPNIRPK